MAVDGLLYCAESDTISYERDLECGKKLIIQSQDHNRRKLEGSIPSVDEMTTEELVELSEAIDSILALLDLS